MAKRRFRRFHKKGRWAPNIIKLSNSISTSVGEWYATEDLAVNPIQTNTGVSQTFTVKNFEITFTLENDGSGTAAGDLIEAVTAFIMFVPQGMQVTSSYYAEHPEYIMAYKYLGSPTGKRRFLDSNNSLVIEEDQQFQPYRIKTRLSRKLQTGDKIILYVQGSTQSVSTLVNIGGIVRWWSKAN